MGVFVCACLCVCVHPCVCAAEVLRLQEAGRQLQAEAMMEGQRRLEEVGAQEQSAARLEQDLQAAHTQCAKRQQVHTVA